MHLTSQLHFTISMMGMHFLPSFPTLQFSVECAVLLVVLVLGMGQHVMPIGPLKPHANDGLDWPVSSKIGAEAMGPGPQSSPCRPIGYDLDSVPMIATGQTHTNIFLDRPTGPWGI